MAGSPFEDPNRERTWILTATGWRKVGSEERLARSGAGVIAVESLDEKKILCIALPNASGIVAEAGLRIGVNLQPFKFPRNRRYHIRGKIYLWEGDLEILRERIRREIAVD